MASWSTQKGIPTPPYGDVVKRVFSSPFISDDLCRERLGHRQDTIEAAKRYLGLQVTERPNICHFFDSEFYGAKYADPPLPGFDPFLHFMSMGCDQERSPHPLVDPRYIRSIDPHALRDGYGLSDLYEILHYGLVDPSPYFSVEFYRSQVPGLTQDFLAHFLTIGLQVGLRPNPLFDPLWYNKRLDGDHDALSGIRHFVLLGDLQGRAPSADFSGRRYFDSNADVAESGVPALAHYLTNGKSEGRPYYPEKIETKLSKIHFETNADGRSDVALSPLVYRWRQGAD